MRASDILRQVCVSVAGHVHVARRRMMLASVDSLVRGRRLTLTELGRGLESSTTQKHRIKAMDRFLGNHRAHDDVRRWYMALARRLLRGLGRPVVLLDWTQTISGRSALVAAVAFSGRAIPIYAEVHHDKLLGNREVQIAFLATLATVLGAASRPVIVADAGFKTPFFAAVRARRWDFVIRLRGKGVLRRMGRCGRHRDPRLRFSHLFASADHKSRDIGMWTPYAAQGALGPEYRIVLAPKPKKADGKPRADAYARRGAEPWLLATSLTQTSATAIVDLYALRMQIELSFRDAKNGNLGWGLEHARSRGTGRQSVLLLIVCLALAATLLVGAHAERSDQASQYQANSTRSRRVQSLYRLGVLVLAERMATIPIARFLDERQLIRRFLRTGVQLRLPSTTLHYGQFR